jgi:quercetin dioxygenase-like cupin family protein
VEGSYFRINLPRSDLTVRIGNDTLSPRFEFTSYIGFAPNGRSDVLAMGEIILLQSEVPAVLMEAYRQGVEVTAVHNHLMNETPRIMYVHVMAEGAPGAVASKLHSLFAKSATPLTPPSEEKPAANWSAIDRVLGPHAEAEGSVAEYVFPRHERLSVHGTPVESSGVIETASEVVFQQLGNERVASTGELFLLPSEVEKVLRALDDHGLHVTALHNHMVDDMPRMYWVHWFTTGDGPTLARGVAAALAHMNGVRRSVAER